MLAIWRLRAETGKKLENERKTETYAEEPSLGNSWRLFLSLEFVMFLAVIAIRTMSVQIIETFMPTYLTDERGLTVAEASMIYGSFSLSGILAAPLGGYFASRFGEKRWLVTTVLLSAICLALAASAPNIAVFVVLYLCYGFFNTLGMAANSAIMAKLTPSYRRGVGYAFFFLPGSLTRSLSPIIGAYAATSMGMWSIFPISVFIALIALITLKFGVKV